MLKGFSFREPPLLSNCFLTPFSPGNCAYIRMALPQPYPHPPGIGWMGFHAVRVCTECTLHEAYYGSSSCDPSDPHFLGSTACSSNTGAIRMDTPKAVLVLLLSSMLQQHQRPLDNFQGYLPSSDWSKLLNGALLQTAATMVYSLLLPCRVLYCLSKGHGSSEGFVA